MKNTLKLTPLVLFLILAFGQATYASSQGVKSNELIENAKQYDEKSVRFSGEVIGDVMLRGKFAWINISDGDNAIGVWVSADLAKEIDFTGSYKAKGDILEASGIFHRACLQHGGDLDIHAETLRKISRGQLVRQKLDLFKTKSILVLLGALFLIWILTLFKRK